MSNRTRKANKMQEAFLRNVRMIREDKAADYSESEMQSSDDEEVHVPEKTWSKPSTPRSVPTRSRLGKYQKPPKKPLSFDPIVKGAAVEAATRPSTSAPASEGTPTSAVAGNTQSRSHRKSIYSSGALMSIKMKSCPDS